MTFAERQEKNECTPNQLTQEGCAQIQAYFDKNLTKFDLPVDLGTMKEFGQKVLKMVSQIPYGSTMSYSQIGIKMGNANASRAVGHANATNPIPLIIPCHRVIGSNGKLTGYLYGTSVKKRLLHLENPKRWPIQQSLF